MLNETSPLLGDSGNEPVHTENGGEPEETPQDSVGTEETRSTKFYLTLMAPMMFGILLAAMDGTIVTSSYAAIGSDFKQLQSTSWMATVSLLTMASFQPLFGKLSDIFGRKACLLFAHTVFAVGCLLCGLSRTMNELIGSRAITGIGSGGISTIISIIASDVVPLRARGTWQGILNIVFAIGSAAGAPLGGFVTDSIGWRWAFLLQVPVALIAILTVLLALHLPKTTTSDFGTKIRRVDFGGALTLVLAVFFLLLGLDRGGNVSWQDRMTIATLVAFAVMSTLFVLIEIKYAQEPFAPKRIVSDGSLLGGYLSNFFGMAAILSIIFHVSLYLQAIQGRSASQASLWLILTVVGSSVGSLGGGLIIQFTGKFYMITLANPMGLLAGTIITVLVTGVMVQSRIGVGIGLITSSLGSGGGITTSLVSLIANASLADQAIVTAVSYLFRSLGAVVGLSVGSTLIQNFLKRTLQHKLAGSDVDRIVQRVRESLTYIEQLDPATQAIVRGAYEEAICVALWFTVIMAACSMVSAVFVKEKPLVRK